MIDRPHSLKYKLQNLREGEVLTVSTKDLANFHNGGAIRIPNGQPTNERSPYHLLSPQERGAAIVQAYNELRLLLRQPPPGVVAEELPGSQFKVRFARINGIKGVRP